MTDYTVRSASPPPLAVTRRPRNPQDLCQVQWHSTRGNVALDLQVQATENWFANPLNDRGGWGGSADFVVGPDRRVGGQVVIVEFGDWLNTFSTWSAGYGAAGTLPASQYGIAIEVAQRALNDPFDGETIEACTWLAKDYIPHLLRQNGVPQIPPVWIGDWEQLPSQPVPRGHIGHDTTANGRRLGKTDPGPNFPLGTILDAIQRPPPPTAEEVRTRYEAEMAALISAVDAAVAPFRR